jgi:hypothetical protein
VGEYDWILGTPDDREICRLIQAEDFAGLEEAMQIVDSFPHGQLGTSSAPYWITIAAGAGALGVVDWMLDKGVTADVSDGGQEPPLHCALALNDDVRYAMLDKLIAAGCDVNRHGIHDWTPLQMAAVREDFRAMEVLLDAGADPCRRTRIDESMTPAEEARNLGHPAAADFIDRYVAECSCRG